ncbi:MAG: hypothetical protein WC310_05805 [Patescibacteria group bacterium]|jgi:chitinase
MINNYYIQLGTDVAVDIFNTYGIYVSKTEGLDGLPDAKEPFSRDWAEEQGLDVFLPDVVTFKERQIKITFAAIKTLTSEAKSNVKNFLKYLFSEEQFCYFDTFKKEGFRGYYSKHEIKNAKYVEYTTYIEFEMTFVAPNGICFGQDISSSTGITCIVEDGVSADFYFSDGTSVLGATESFNDNKNANFVIILPSVFDGAYIETRSNKLFGYNGKIFGYNGKIFGY